MPVITSQQDRPICPAGPHIVTLMEVELREMDNFEKTGKVDRLLWKFLTKKVAPDGDPYELTLFTGTKYGPSRAKLTGLLDMLMPGITPQQADNLDTDELVGQKFETMIKHTASTTDASKMYAEPLYFRSLTAKQPAGEIVNDPFQDA